MPKRYDVRRDRWRLLSEEEVEKNAVDSEQPATGEDLPRTHAAASGPGVKVISQVKHRWPVKAHSWFRPRAKVISPILTRHCVVVVSCRCCRWWCKAAGHGAPSKLHAKLLIFLSIPTPPFSLLSALRSFRRPVDARFRRKPSKTTKSFSVTWPDEAFCGGRLPIERY